MRAVVFMGERELEFMDFDDPTPGPGEVVIEMKASGMCGSDLKFYRAPKGGITAALGLGDLDGPIIGGHEPCGVVCEVGEGVPEDVARIGQRMMVHHYKGCGVCKHCRVGWQQLCRDGVTVYGATGHGAHAKYMKIPASTLVELPDELSYEAGAAISCGTGTAYGALRRINISGHQTIAIFGQGPVGLSATQLASSMGARVIALDIGSERRALANEFGADAVIDPSANDVDPVAQIHELTHGEGADLTLDCTGIPEARINAVRSAKTWGTACFVVSPDMIRKQLTIVASWTFSAIGQAECARYIADRGIDVDHLFSDRYVLDQADEAYRLFDTQTTGKGVFLFE